MTRPTHLPAFVLALSVLLSAQPASADATVRAYVQPEGPVAENSTVRLVIQLDGAQRGEFTEPNLGSLTNLKRVSGPERRFSSVWTNGVFTQMSQLVYTLVPLAPGPATIGPMQLTIGGRTVRTEAIGIDVTPAPAGVPPPRSAPTRGNQPSSPPPADVFVTAKLGAERVWLGEPVALTMSLYTAERVLSPSLAAEPELSDFWVEHVDVDADAEASRVDLDGRTYLVYPMVRKIIVPQTTGRIEIEPFVLRIPVTRRGGRDPFRLFSSGRTDTVVRKTKPLTLDVRPLPREGRPEDFGGAVGRFEFSVTRDRAEVPVNEAVALRAVVTGPGFLRGVAPPRLEPTPELKVFDPEVDASQRTDNGRLTSRRKWEWILVPLAPGEFAIPELRFAYFDPKAGEYRVATADAGTLVVRRGDETVAGVASASEIRPERRDLAFIKPAGDELRRRSVGVQRQAVFLAVAGAPLVWGPIWVLAGRRRARLARDGAGARARRARKRARARIDGARRTEDQSLYDAVDGALVGFVADRADRSASGLSHDEVERLLADQGVDETLRARFRDLIESCDRARFVPDSTDAGRRRELADDAARLIDDIEAAT